MIWVGVIVAGLNVAQKCCHLLLRELQVLHEASALHQTRTLHHLQAVHAAGVQCLELANIASVLWMIRLVSMCYACAGKQLQHLNSNQKPGPCGAGMFLPE